MYAGFQVVRTKPGDVAPEACWIIYGGDGYMYGPHESLLYCIWLALTEWHDDNHLCG